MFSERLPVVPGAGPDGSNTLTDAQFEFWVSKYAELVKRTAAACKRQSQGFMIWTSNDRLWERPNQADGEPLHTGVRPFLDKLWPKLGASNFTWSLAVHPYDAGNPMDDHEFDTGYHPQAYTFASLNHVVEYQKKQVRAIGGLDPDSEGAQGFQWLYASEQGWPSPGRSSQQSNHPRAFVSGLDLFLTDCIHLRMIALQPAATIVSAVATSASLTRSAQHYHK